MSTLDELDHLFSVDSDTYQRYLIYLFDDVILFCVDRLLEVLPFISKFEYNII